MRVPSRRVAGPEGLRLDDAPTRAVNGWGFIRTSFEAVGLPRLTSRGGTRMELQRDAGLGLAGRFALARAVENGCPLRVAAAAFGASSATAWRWLLSDSPRVPRSEQHSSVLTIARAGRDGCRDRSPHASSNGSARPGAARAGAAAADAPERASARDDLEGACPTRIVATAAARARPRAVLRVPLPGRPAAHRCGAQHAFPPARPWRQVELAEKGRRVTRKNEKGAPTRSAPS
jgi:hypothetical protein